MEKMFKCVKCGYISDHKIDKCPICGHHEFEETKISHDALVWAQEHKIPEIDIHKDLDEVNLAKLRGCFDAETTEVGMYLAMSRQAFREGYPYVGQLLRQIAFEEAEHAARFCEILGEKVSSSTKENLRKAILGENGACQTRYEIATYAKQNNLDSLHDPLHEISKDESRHGKALLAAYETTFGKFNK